jgi:hypothetical protein
VAFRAYAMNEDEKLLFEDKMKNSEINDMLNISKNLSDESLKQLQKEIESFEKKEEPKKEKEESMFSGILKDFMKTITPETKSELYKRYAEICEKSGASPKSQDDMTIEGLKIAIKDAEKKKKEQERLEKIKKGGMGPDSFEEAIVRERAEVMASEFCFNIFDKFKKSRGMASSPNPFDEPDVYKRLRERRAEIAASLKK